MKKPIIFVLFFGLLLLLALPSMAAESACLGYKIDQFNGLPACVKNGQLHICDKNFPDTAFTRHLHTHQDTNGDGSLSANECNIESLTISDAQLQSLEGIDYFSSLRILDCSGCMITSLDLKCLPNLTELNCEENRLSVLDMSNNPKLEFLDCSSNLLHTLNVRNCTMLKRLDCNQNQLLFLDLSTNFCLTAFNGGRQTFTPPVTVHAGNLRFDLTPLIGEENLHTVTLKDPSFVQKFDAQTGLVSFRGSTTIRLEITCIIDPEGYKAFHGVTYPPSYHRLDVTVSVDCPHEWTAPGCAWLSRCRFCYTVDPDSRLPHTYEDNSCTADAYCTQCGEKKSGHSPNPGAWVIQKEATWDEPGLKIRNCMQCGIQLESEPVRAIKDTPKGEYILSMQALERSVKITRVFDLLTFAAVILSLLITIITDLLPPRKKHEK